MGMTLEDAADDLSAKLGALDEDIREATAAFAALRDRAAALQDDLDQDFAALETQAQELLAAAAEEQATVTREADETEQSLGTLTDALEAGETALQADLAEAETGSKELAAHVTGLEPGLLEAVSELESTGRELATDSADAESQWEQAFAQSRTMQDEMTAGLERLDSELRRQADEAEQEVLETEAPRLDASVAGWETVLRDVESKEVEGGLETLRSDFENGFGEALAAGLEHARTQVGEAITAIEGVSETTYGTLIEEELSCLTRLQDGEERAAAAVDELLDWLTALDDAFSAVRDELTSLGFM